jgi:hypothetical protein
MKQGYNQKYGRSIPVIPSDNLSIPNPANIVALGQTTAFAADLLIDTDADFIRQGVEVGATVYNLDTLAGATVVTVIGGNRLELSADIFPAASANYKIGNVTSGLGCALWTGTGGRIIGTTIEGDIIQLTNAPAGVILPIIFKSIDSTSTTANTMIALFE